MSLYKNNYLKIILFIIGLIFLCFPPTADARGNLRIGRLLVDSAITYSLEYNDNIYSSDTNEEDDIVHLVKPEVNLSYTLRPQNFIKAGYHIDIAKYSDNDTNNYEVHRPHIIAQWKSPKGLYISAKDFFLKTADPYGDENEYALGIPQTKRWHNNFTVVAGYEFGNSLTVETNYNNNKKKYDHTDDQWQDRTANGFGAAVLYKVTPKASALLQYQRTQAKYDKQNDEIYDSSRNLNWSSHTSQDYHTDVFFIGTRFAPVGKLTGEVKVGYGFHTFENDIDPEGKTYHDEEGFMAETVIKYALRSRTKFELTLDRNFTPSPDTDANAYINTSGSLGIFQELGNRFKTHFQFGLTNINYLDELPGRQYKEFNIYQFSAGIGWRFARYFTAGAEYRFKKKNSGNSYYKKDEYERNVFAVSLNAQF